MWLFLAGFVSTVVGVFLFFQPLIYNRVGALMRTIGVAVNNINNFQLGEDEEIEVGQKYALLILKELFLTTLAMVVLVGIAGLPFFFVDYSGFSAWEIILWVLGGVVVASLLYFWLLHKPPEGATEYSESKQLLYYLTLGFPALNRLSHKLNRLFGKSHAADYGIIVTGLARAGTTTLLRHLHQHPHLHSISYRAMPFLLAPHLWHRFNRKKSEAEERSHQDGIFVSLDSPEAFDEYFWRIILKEKYYQGDALQLHQVSENEVAQYESYLGNYLEPSGIYLSKNNNFILRLQSFLGHRPNYLALLVFREPVSHAKSLLRQQALQTQSQEEDPFVLDYMNWLGHHEFGKGRKDFDFGQRQLRYQDREDFNYWLERWVDYYQYALSLEHANIFFISNRSIASRPQETVNRVLGQFHLLLEAELPAKSPKEPEAPEGTDEKLLAEARKTYQALLNQEEAAFRRLAEQSLAPQPS